MRNSLYHSILRVSLLVVASVLVFDSGLVHPITKQISDETISYLASTGSSVTLSIPENEINKLAAELSAQKQALDEREAALGAREIDARQFETSGGADYSTYVLSLILFILSVLIVLNYAMDWARARSFKYAQQVA